MPLNPFEITGGLAIGEGVGGAIADTVEPRLQKFKNDQWSKHKDKPLDAETAAEVAAEEVDLYTTMETQASFSGYDETRFADLYRVTLTAPGVGTLIQLLRRDGEVPIDFEHGLRKAKLGNQWDKALRNLRDVRIPAPDLAYMVVRDLVPNPFGGSGPTGPNDDTISDIPQLAIDTLKEADKTGWDATRFEALVGRSGLAPAPILAANAFFRGIITWPQYKTIIAKGDLRPAYTNVILNAAREILTAGQYSEAELRGYIDATTRRASTAKHGMSREDSDLLHLIQGRPLAVHQVTTGLARGGKHGGLYSDVPQPYQDAIRQSNIKEPWAGLAYANRYSYPSAFVLRSLAQAGEIGDAAAVKQILLEIGWPPALAEKVSLKWQPSAAAADPHVSKAQTQLWNTLHSSYIAGESTKTAARPVLSSLGVTGASQTAVLDLWDAERALVRKQLTPAQIKKAYVKGIKNQATGATWTRDDALAALLERGYAPADANEFLDL